MGCVVMCALMVTGLLSGFALIFGNPWDGNPFDDYRFQASAWRQDEDVVTAGNRRGHMAEDILKRQLEPAMTLSHVERIIGEPESVLHAADLVKHPVRKFTAKERAAATLLSYYLGEELNGAAGIDRAWLHLRFDKRGRYLGGRVYPYQTE
jgi:hypothetical protein